MLAAILHEKTPGRSRAARDGAMAEGFCPTIEHSSHAIAIPMNATHDTTLSFRPAGASDRALLEELVRAYYDFDDHEYEPALHGRALDAAIENAPDHY